MGSPLRPDPAAVPAPAGPATGWSVTVVGTGEEQRRVAESLLTVADGTVGTRGALEEDGPATVPLVMAAGAFQPGGDGPVPLPGPLWHLVDVQPGRDGPSVRWLDLLTGVLHRRDSGVASMRFACLARPGTLVQRTTSARPVPEGPPLVAPAGLAPSVTCDRWQEGDVTGMRLTALGGVAAAAVESRTGTAARSVVDRIAVVTAARDHAPARAQVTTPLSKARTSGVDGLHAEQRRAWAARWRDADIVIEGDDDLQTAVRFALFHVMATVADAGAAPVGARGLSGTAYAGHVFWDADVFVLPMLAATHPASSRAMLQYRIDRLEAARARARDEGCEGARFPWESAHDGTEATPTSWTGFDGTQVPVRTGQQELHVSSDVAWAAWQHVQWSGDRDLLAGPGRALVVDTAAWWAGRIEIDADGSGHLRGVIGPDEYHEDVDDNLYTNELARWNLRLGADLLDGDPASRDRANHWRRLADRLAPAQRRPDGSHEQFRGYDDLEDVDVTALTAPPFAADVLLGHERVGQTQVVKQADVLMLHHVLPDVLPSGSLEADLDHYLPRTAHGSSLSPGIHASLLARAGRADEAAAWLRIAARLDLDDLTGTTAGGLHLATMGSVWQALVVGFLGARARPAGLHVDPRPLPTGWRRLAARLRFRDEPVELDLRPGRLTVRPDHAHARIPVLVPGGPAPLPAPLVLTDHGGTWRPEVDHAP